MPNPNQSAPISGLRDASPRPANLGLQKASGIGPDPLARPTEAGMPDPEGRGAVGALLELARKYTGPVQETLGELDPQFTPVGGEGMYNAAKVGAKPFVPTDVYQSILHKFGMGK